MKANTVQAAQLLVAVIALFGTWVIATVAVKTFDRGPVPAKHLFSLSINGTNALEYLHKAHDVITSSVADAKGNKIENMYSVLVTLKNTGSSPIQYSDFFGKIKLLTKEPWRILTINGVAEDGNPSFVWKKISDTEFEADPILINPQDELVNIVYMTSTKPQEELLPKPPLSWNLRVVNLDGVEYAAAPVPQSSFIPQLLNVSVSYVGNSVLLILGLY
jgi:hypothetical protein